MRLTLKVRILAIDDQPYFRSFLEGLLSEAGYSVETASSGRAAKSKLSSGQPFDAIILDPIASGLDSAREVEEVQRQAPGAAVIVLSGQGDVVNIVESMRAGAVDFLLKPADCGQLLGALRRAVNARDRRSLPDGLAGENLRVMGEVSLYERGVALMGISDLRQAAQGVLEMLAIESGAESGVCWVADPGHPGRDYPVAVNESVPGATWSTGDASTDERVRRGEARELSAGGGVPATLFLPLNDAGISLGVVRLRGASLVPASELLNARRLSETILATARRQEELSQATLRDPRSGLPSRAFLEEVLAVEVNKAQRFGRRIACLCLEVKGDAIRDAGVFEALSDCIRRSLRATDMLFGEGSGRFWVLVTDTDSLGGVVLKRRLSERVDELLGDQGSGRGVAVGVASFPLDAERSAELLDRAIERAGDQWASLIHELDLAPESSLSEIGTRLLSQAETVPAQLVPAAAELLIGELTARPRDRGLLFVAPGSEATVVLGPLAALGDGETSPEVFVATDSDTVPSGTAVTAVGLPSNVPSTQTWIVRFGEAPPYALVAGEAKADGTRSVFQSCDPALIEHMTFRLRCEVGFGVRG